MCYQSVLRLLIVWGTVASLAVGAASSLAALCDSVVDSADSLDFHQLHQDCPPEKPAQAEAAPTPKASTAAKASVSGDQSHSAAANFQLAQGSQAAQQQLLETMAATCPQGWHKLDEWTVAVSGGFRLYYRFQCR